MGPPATTSPCNLSLWGYLSSDWVKISTCVILGCPPCRILSCSAWVKGLQFRVLSMAAFLSVFLRKSGFKQQASLRTWPLEDPARQNPGNICLVPAAVMPCSHFSVRGVWRPFCSTWPCSALGPMTQVFKWCFGWILYLGSFMFSKLGVQEVIEEMSSLSHTCIALNWSNRGWHWIGLIQ